MSCLTEIWRRDGFSTKKNVTLFQRNRLRRCFESRTGSFHVKGKKSLKYVRLKEARNTHFYQLASGFFGTLKTANLKSWGI